MRILFLVNGHLRSDNYPHVNMGGSVQTWGLCKELAKKGHEVYIVRRSRNAKEEIVDRVKLIGVAFKGAENALPNTKFMYHVFLLLSKFYFSVKSYSIIKRINPDVLCFIDRQTAIFPAILNLPKVFIIHSPEAMDFFKADSLRANRMHAVLFYVVKVLQDIIMRRSNCVVVLNNYMKNYLMKQKKVQVVTISNGVDVVNFSSRKDKDFILYAGRFDWNKNVYNLAEAFVNLEKKYPDYRLCLVGEGPEERRIKMLIAENTLQSKVTMLPWLPRAKLAEILRDCSVFVLPSLFEVSPVVVLEAMSSSKPVIAKTNMGTVDVVVDGKTGYLYSNDEELRKYLGLLISDRQLRKTVGSNGRRLVEEKYTFGQIANEYEKLFLRVIGVVDNFDLSFVAETNCIGIDGHSICERVSVN